MVVLLGLGVLAGGGVGAAWWLVCTESGIAWALEWALARAPGVAVGGVRGTLLNGVVLENVRVRLPRDELDVGRLALEWDAAPALHGTLVFRSAAATTAAYRRVEARTANTAPWSDLPFTVRVNAATIDALTITVDEKTAVFGPTEVAASLNGSRLAVQRIATSSSGFTLTATGDVDIAGAPALSAAVQWSGAIGATPASGNATLSGTWPLLLVRHDLTTPFAAHAEGSVNFAQAPSVELAIDWLDAAWPGVDAVASPSGRIMLAGTLADYRYEGAGALAIEGRAAAFSARGTGGGMQLVLERFDVDARNGAASAGAVAAQGSVNLAARRADINVTLTDIDPQWWEAGWPGRLRGTTAVHAALTPTSVAFDALDISGVLRGYPLALRGAAQYTSPDQWRLAGVRLASGANRVAVDGALTSAGLELVADVDVANLDLLWPGLRGAATGKVAVGGSFDQPTGSGRLVGHGLTYRDFKLEQITIEGELGGSPAAPLALRLEASGATGGPVRLERLVAAANGTTGAHRVTLDIDAPEWHSHAEATGALSARTWRGTLSRAEFDEELLGRWQLVEPAALAVGMRAVSLATACLEHPSAGRWCGALDIRGQPSDRLVLVAQNFDLKTLRPLLPPAVSLEGICQLSASLFDLTGNPRGALALTGENTHVRATTGEQQTYAADLDELRAAGTLANGRVELLAALRSGDAGKLDLNASIRDVRLSNSAIEGTLSLAWPDVGFLTLLAPELGQLGGSVEGEIAVGGTVNEPEVDGRAAWQGGRVAVAAWGLVIEGIEATASSRDGRALEFDAKGHVGEGVVTLIGQTELDPNANWPTRLALRGEAVRAVQLPEAEIFVTPDLAAMVAWPDVRVTGTVKVPRASLGLSALPARAVVPSPDAVVHGRTGSPVARRLQLHAAVDMVLGDEVHYAGLNLDTKVTGALHVDAQPNRSAIATGALTLKGTYDAYGQHLTLERGQLLFAGPLDDPGVDVRAVRTVDTTRVGVELAGTIKSPRTRIFSTPTLSEADALSYLLLGRPMTGTGTEETATLQTAALAMGLNQALPVVQRLGATLGLDELSVQSTATDAGALMAGKYLSPKLYIRYSYGLFNRIGGLLLRFKVNERLSVETRSGDQKSMDLLYTVEKD
ncbi:MAG: translocation/assembly module TamB domain-containing protein [Gammaproteobacteria bacterium]